jgi:hypothetical protein
MFTGFAVVTVLAGSGWTVAAAQPAAPPTAAAPAASTATRKAVEQRVAALSAKLGITPAQQSDWNTFAQVMRDNAASTDAVFAQRAQSTATMNAVDNMKSYAAIARGYADNTQRLSDAFAVLYGKLSDAQKQTADVLFRQAPAPVEKHSGRRR